MISECWWCEKPYDYTGEPLEPNELDVCPECKRDDAFNEVLDRLYCEKLEECKPFEQVLREHDKHNVMGVVAIVIFLAGYCVGFSISSVLNTLCLKL